MLKNFLEQYFLQRNIGSEDARYCLRIPFQQYGAKVKYPVFTQGLHSFKSILFT
jgi:hypothetical protein